MRRMLAVLFTLTFAILGCERGVAGSRLDQLQPEFLEVELVGLDTACRWSSESDSEVVVEREVIEEGVRFRYPVDELLCEGDLDGESLLSSEYLGQTAFPTIEVVVYQQSSRGALLVLRGVQFQGAALELGREHLFRTIFKWEVSGESIPFFSDVLPISVGVEAAFGLSGMI